MTRGGPSWKNRFLTKQKKSKKQHFISNKIVSAHGEELAEISKRIEIETQAVDFENIAQTGGGWFHRPRGSRGAKSHRS